jgi:hypothetical protein
MVYEAAELARLKIATTWEPHTLTHCLVWARHTTYLQQ